MRDASTSSVEAGTSPAARLSDPLPEGRWLFRRTLTFLVSAAILILIWRLSEGVIAARGTDQALVMFKWLVGYLALLQTYYLVGPTAEQLTRLIQAAAALRAGVTFRSAAVAESPDGRAQSSTVAGIPSTSGESA